MNIERTFEHLDRRIHGYVFAAASGKKNPKLVALLFSDCDDLTRASEDDPQLAQAVQAFVNATEELIRQSHIPGRGGFDTARQRHAENAAQLRNIIASKAPPD